MARHTHPFVVIYISKIASQVCPVIHSTFVTQPTFFAVLRHTTTIMNSLMKCAIASIVAFPVWVSFTFWKRICLNWLFMSFFELCFRVMAYLKCAAIRIFLLVKMITFHSTKPAQRPITLPLFLSFLKSQSARIAVFIHTIKVYHTRWQTC